MKTFYKWSRVIILAFLHVVCRALVSTRSYFDVSALPSHDRKRAGKFDALSCAVLWTSVWTCLHTLESWFKKGLSIKTVSIRAVPCRLTHHEDFRGGSGHSGDRQTERGGPAENCPLSVFRGKCFICRLLPDGAGRHAVQTHRGWAKVRALITVRTMWKHHCLSSCVSHQTFTHLVEIWSLQYR